MDYGPFNSLPAWDRALADFLQPVRPFAFVLLLTTGFAAIYFAVKYRDKPELLVLALAYIWSP